MPTYEYECEGCGVHDVEQRITAPALIACDRCGAKVRRLISRSSFALRGGGWYADGYAGKGDSAAPATPPHASPPGGLQKAG